MIVCDAGPLNFLIRIDAVAALPALYGRVSVPHAVRQELGHPRTPSQIGRFLLDPPPWMDFGAPQDNLVHGAALHFGEQAVLLCAAQMPGAWALLDDRNARLEASKRGLPTIGTLALLYDAGLQGLVDFESSLEQLIALQFRISEPLRFTYLERWRHFKESGA